MSEDSVALPPSDEETTDEDLKTILNSPKEDEEPLVADGIFESISPKVPIYKSIPLKAGLAGFAAMVLLLPILVLFSGNLLKKDEANSPQSNTFVAKAEETEEEKALRESEEANSDLRRQLALQNQSFTAADMEDDAEGQSAAPLPNQSPTASPGSMRPTSRPPSSPAAPSSVASRPISSPSSPPPRLAPPPYRPAPVTVASRVPVSYTQSPNSQPSTRVAEPVVDPFERRDQLQTLGSYGAPPPMRERADAQLVSQRQSSDPSGTQYVKTLSQRPQAQNASFQSQDYPVDFADKSLTEAEKQYEQDAAAVLLIDSPEAIEQSSESVTPLAIMPGTSAAAELPYGFSWQEGSPLPEVIILTTEDIMAGEQVVIPVGTQFLGQAQIDPRSGAVAIQIIEMLSETDMLIPRASILVRSADGSVLTAIASGRAARGSSSNIGGFLIESLGNTLGNVLGNGDSIAGDVAGGVAETVTDNQVERSEANAAARNSRAASQPFVWMMDERSQVSLTFNTYIPLSRAL